MPGQIPQAIKEERNQRLLEVVNALGAQAHQKFVGRRVEVLVEGPSKRNPARMTGRTRCNKIVVLDASPRACGTLLDVKLQRAGTFTLYGEVVEADGALHPSDPRP
jgi:tRNA-2-methylthio-N6-dimethylallyladenosine synthase